MHNDQNWVYHSHTVWIPHYKHIGISPYPKLNFVDTIGYMLAGKCLLGTAHNQYCISICSRLGLSVIRLAGISNCILCSWYHNRLPWKIVQQSRLQINLLESFFSLSLWQFVRSWLSLLLLIASFIVEFSAHLVSYRFNSKLFCNYKEIRDKPCRVHANQREAICCLDSKSQQLYTLFRSFFLQKWKIKVINFIQYCLW